MKKYVINEIYSDGYERFAVVEETEHNAKFAVKFLEFDEYLENGEKSQKRKIGDVLEGDLSIDLISKSQKVNKELAHFQSIENSPYIETIVEVSQIVDKYSAYVISSILDEKLLVEFEGVMDYKVGDRILICGELKFCENDKNKIKHTINSSQSMNHKKYDVLSIFHNSNKQVHIYEGTEMTGDSEIENMGININSVLSVIVRYTAGICVDNWIRVIGQRCNTHKGILQYNSEQISDVCMLKMGMQMVAQDVVGGIFAINISRFAEGRKQVWYFAPDTLEWECLEMDYAEFIAWTAQGNTDEFYDSMRWETWKEDCKHADFDEACLIYPFMWSKECDLSTASKRIVPFKELEGMNFEHAKKIDNSALHD